MKRPSDPAHLGRVARSPGDTPRLTATIAEMVRSYPGRSTAVVGLTFLAGMSEALGLVALLPLLSLVTGEQEDLPILSDAASTALERTGLTPTVGLLLIVICALIGLKALLRLISMRQAGYAAADVERDLRLGLVRALMTARWNYFTSQPIGSLSNAVSSEAGRARQVFTKSAELLARSLQVVIYISVAFIVSWEVAVLSLLFGAAMIVALRSLVRFMRRAGQAETDSLKSLISGLSDGLYSLKPLKAMGREEQLQPRLETEIGQLHSAARRQSLSWAVMESVHEPIVALFVSLTIYIMFVSLGFPFSQVIFIAFLLYRTTTYVGGLQKGVQAFYQFESAFWSIRWAIDEAEQQAESLPSSGEGVAVRSSIEFDRVSFRYGDDPVLVDASLTIPARSMTAFIGPSGAGKTTIVDLMAGLYEPDSGVVRVDGIDLWQTNIHAWRLTIGYVPQELILFHDSIHANIALNDPSVSREDVETALADAGALDFVRQLPDGIDTVVGEKGTRFSGGQRQRLAIARALARRPELLILDEATTALDPGTERALLSTLCRLKDRMTIVAISHQTGIVDAADVVYELTATHDGAIVRRAVRATGSAAKIRSSDT